MKNLRHKTVFTVFFLSAFALLGLATLHCSSEPSPSSWSEPDASLSGSLPLDGGHKFGALGPQPTGTGVPVVSGGQFAVASVNGTSGLPFVSNGASSTPTFQQLSIASGTNVTGTLATGNGGTGLATVGTGYLHGNGTSNSYQSIPSGDIDWAHPGTIGSGTANTGAFTTLNATTQAGTTTSIGDAGGTMSKFTDNCVETKPGANFWVDSCTFEVQTTDGTTWTAIAGFTVNNSSGEGIVVSATGVDFTGDASFGNLYNCDLRFVVQVDGSGNIRVTPEFGDTSPNPTSPSGLTSLSCTGALNDAGGVGPAVTYRVTWSGSAWTLQTLGLATTTIAQTVSLQRNVRLKGYP